jgi:hypothetical protein
MEDHSSTIRELNTYLTYRFLKVVYNHYLTNMLRHCPSYESLSKSNISESGCFLCQVTGKSKESFATATCQPWTTTRFYYAFMQTTCGQRSLARTVPWQLLYLASLRATLRPLRNTLGFRSNPLAIERFIQPTCFTSRYYCLQSTGKALTNMVWHNDSTLPSVGEV